MKIKTGKYMAGALAALAIVVACSKDGPRDAGDTSWAYDLTKAVPIVFGTGSSFSVKSKAAIESLEGVEFGVLALDLAKEGQWNQANPEQAENVLLMNKVAKGVSSNAQFITTEGENVTYYYPLETLDSHDYSFFAYHTSDVSVTASPAVHELSSNGVSFIKSVAIGTTDVLWAKAEATPFVAGGVTYTGFNTDYQRMARRTWPDTWLENYAPKFTFKHVTTALHFNIVAEDANAAATFISADGAAQVTVRDLRVFSASEAGLPGVATLDVLSGRLTAGDASGAYEPVSFAPVSEPVLPTVPTAGSINEYGTGLFLVPTTDQLRVSFTVDAPTGSFSPSDESGLGGYSLNAPTDDGFEAGKSYTFRIVVRSLEDIRIVLELAEWQDGFSDEDRQSGDDVVVIIG